MKELRPKKERESGLLVGSYIVLISESKLVIIWTQLGDSVTLTELYGQSKFSLAEWVQAYMN